MPRLYSVASDEQKECSLQSNLSNWTEYLPDSEHARFFKSTNWAATPLGPLETWGLALRLHVLTTFADSRPSALYWGPERVAIYNEPFIPLSTDTHPTLMGMPFRFAFPEICDTIYPIFDTAEKTGKAVDVNEIELFLNRSGFKEEAYFTGNFNPIRGEDGRVAGFLNSVHEVTNQRLQDRRTAMINLIAAAPPNLDSSSIGHHVVESFKTNERDVPMAMLYQVDEEATLGTCVLYLRGLHGISSGHKLAVDKTSLQSQEGIIPLLREARASGIVTVPVDDKFDGIDWRGFEEASKFVSFVALSSGGRLFGFLVIGLNPRRDVDAASHQFMRDLSRQLAATMASVVSAEQSRQRELHLQQELAETERQIRYMAEHASVGMQHISAGGYNIWANEQYYKLTNHPPPGNTHAPFSFMDVIHLEDQEKAKEAWQRLIQGESQITIELRLKRLFSPPSGDPEPAHLLVFAFVYKEAGKERSIMSCMTDISHLKWAESWQARNAATAREEQRRLEEFIDIVSHEMRNPLSAMFHCAESITSSGRELERENTSVANCLDALSSNVDAAKQILMCADHQKRIIDDVLMLSRLESHMLSMSPTAIQPAKLVGGVVEMFRSESLSHGITINVIPRPSLSDDWISVDSSRVTQVMVNLFTNAIKFTKHRAMRTITVNFGIAPSDPHLAFPATVKWAARRDTKQIQEELDLGKEKLYLTFSISDTGIGMAKHETQRLFDRFAQASAKTTINYGGSGLGLYISRQLVEAHGGTLGVTSTPDEGSTFAFYVRIGRASAPSNTLSAKDSNASIQASSHPSPGLLAERTQVNILLVEDNHLNAQVLMKQLVKQGCAVDVAGNGLEALEFIKHTDAWKGYKADSKALDVILMDVEMPIMDGLTCTQEIRKLQDNGTILRHIEIIAVTANARSEQVESALAAGVDSVMPKPFSVTNLMKSIKSSFGTAPRRDPDHSCDL